jgi:tyrosine-protein phosphatase SIW14
MKFLSKMVPYWFSLLSLASFTAPQAHSALELVRVREVAPGIYRGSRPEDLKDLLQLKDMGIKTIFNLVTDRSDREWEDRMAAVMGMNVVSVPIIPWAIPSEEKVNFLLAEIQKPENQPVFLHCRHGKDRTGLIFGLYRVEVQGWDPREAYAEMREIGFSPWLMGLEYYYWKRTRPYRQPDADLLQSLALD